MGFVIVSPAVLGRGMVHACIRTCAMFLFLGRRVYDDLLLHIAVPGFHPPPPPPGRSPCCRLTPLPAEPPVHKANSAKEW